MNDFTRMIVTEMAQKHKRLAEKNGYDFACKVEDEAWRQLIAADGWKIKERALRLWRCWHPEMFDDEGYLKHYRPEFDEFEIELSNISVRTLMRRIKADPELQLDDWGDLPRLIAQPQMSMFG